MQKDILCDTLGALYAAALYCAMRKDLGLCVGILFFWGLFVAVRRGQWASAEFPYLSLILFFLVSLSHNWRSLPESMGLIIFLFVMLALAGVPSVCFHLRSSRLWFKERRGNRGPGYVGGCLTAGLILLLAAKHPLSQSVRGTPAARPIWYNVKCQHRNRRSPPMKHLIIAVVSAFTLVASAAWEKVGSLQLAVWAEGDSIRSMSPF